MSTQIKSTASASAPSPSASDPWALAAGMAAPWRTTQYRIDPVAKMLHLWITRHPQPEAVAKKRSWLGLFGTASAPAAAPAPAQGPEMQWRHLNCMDYTCIVHTTDVLEERHHDLPWLGKPGMPFSNRMAKQVIQTVSNGVDEALRVPNTDLRLFGKPESFAKRRMGVALAFDADVEVARTRAKLAASKVKPRVA